MSLWKTKDTYGEKLKDPRWQKRRLQVFERDEWACQLCSSTDSTLNVHHRWYQGEPWDAPDEALVTLCEPCHDFESRHRANMEQGLLRELRKVYFACELDVLSVLSECPTVDGHVTWPDLVHWASVDKQFGLDVAAAYYRMLKRIREERESA